MKIGSGTFAGWTVKDFLAEANKVLGGCDTTYTPQQIEDTIDKINKNHDDGTVNQGFLVCPNRISIKAASMAAFIIYFSPA